MGGFQAFVPVSSLFAYRLLLLREVLRRRHELGSEHEEVVRGGVVGHRFELV